MGVSTISGTTSAAFARVAGAGTDTAKAKAKAAKDHAAADAAAADAARAKREEQLGSGPLGFHAIGFLGGITATTVGATGTYLAYKTNQNNPPQHEANQGRLEAALTHDTRVKQAQESVSAKTNALLAKSQELEDALLAGKPVAGDSKLAPWVPNGAGGTTDAAQRAYEVRIARLELEHKTLKTELSTAEHTLESAVKLGKQNDKIIKHAQYLSPTKVMLYFGALAAVGLGYTVWEAKQGVSLLGMKAKDKLSPSDGK
jgi:hypothetical protein